MIQSDKKPDLNTDMEFEGGEKDAAGAAKVPPADDTATNDVQEPQQPMTVAEKIYGATKETRDVQRRKSK